jgi:hypothetical protein
VALEPTGKRRERVPPALFQPNDATRVDPAAPQVLTGEDMKSCATTLLACLGLLMLAGCTTAQLDKAYPMPPSSAEQDHTAYNNQQVAWFVSRDPGWQAWLGAIQSSDRANNALVDASRYNTPVVDIIQAITAAQDAYKVATSFNLPPFTVTSSCRNLGPETTGSVRLSDGLTVRYSLLIEKTTHFENGSSCVVSVGFIDEVDSSRGLPVVTADRAIPIDWTVSFSQYLAWRQPFWKISTGTTLSLSDLVGLIEK